METLENEVGTVEGRGDRNIGTVGTAQIVDDVVLETDDIVDWLEDTNSRYSTPPPVPSLPPSVPRKYLPDPPL